MLLVGRRTCDLQIAGSSLSRAPLRSGLMQATYTCVPVTNQYNLVLAKCGDLFGWESSRGPGGK